jgi:hypothetical protein
VNVGDAVEYNPTPVEPTPHLDLSAGSSYLSRKQRYTIKELDTGRFETYVYLNEFPGHPFNIKLFTPSALQQTDEDIVTQQIAGTDNSPEHKTTVAEHEEGVTDNEVEALVKLAASLDPAQLIKARVVASLAAHFRFQVIPKPSIKAGLLNKLKKETGLVPMLQKLDKEYNVREERKATKAEFTMWSLLVEMQYHGVIKNIAVQQVHARTLEQMRPAQEIV